MRTVVVAGFGPYMEYRVNPAWECARLLRGAGIDGARVVAVRVPVDYRKIDLVVDRILARKPDIVVGLGLWPKAKRIRVERLAINAADATFPDESGYQPRHRLIVRGAPAAYFLTLPARRIVAELRRAGVPAALSSRPGANPCNYLAYLLRHRAEEEDLGTKCGFIHLPPLPGQVKGRRGMPLGAIARGVRLAIKASLR